jgi:polar amino acid transport system permease protein
MGGNESLISLLPVLLGGFAATLQLAAIAIFGGGLAGLALGIFYVWGGRAIRALLFLLVSVARGVPLVVQVFAVFFVLPTLGLRFSAMTSAAIALTFFAALTIMEIVRGGIEAIAREQVQAALSLGFSFLGAMANIVLPQALRIALPSLVNQSVFMIKATSVVSLFGVGEFLFTAKETIERTLMGFEIMAFVWVAYTLVCYPLTVVGRRWEASLRAHDSARPAVA